MSTKVSIPRWVCCAAAGMSVGFLYFVFTLLLDHWGWNHKIGDEAWIDALGWVLNDFPFGRWIDDGSLRYLLNGLLWSALGSGLYALRLWRGHAA
jgi:hypothetical protein